MNKKVKTLVGVLILVVVIVGATFAYNALSEKFKPTDNLVISPSSTTNDGISTDGTSSTDGKTLTPAPDFTVYDGDGKAVKLSDFLGKPVVLNFWATWCSPCKDELPYFNSAYEKMKDEVHFLMIDSADEQRETVKNGKEFIKKNGYTFPILFDTDSDAAKAYGIDALPTTIFIDSDGNIVAGQTGAIDENTLLVGIGLLKGELDSAPDPADSSVPEREAKYHKITPEKAKEMLDRDSTIILLDVRTEEEFKENRIDGAILIPDIEIEQKAVSELPDKHATILVYCRSGARSKSAVEKLVEMGYTAVYDFGGIISYPFETTSG